MKRKTEEILAALKFQISWLWIYAIENLFIKMVNLVVKIADLDLLILSRTRPGAEMIFKICDDAISDFSPVHII